MIIDWETDYRVWLSQFNLTLFSRTSKVGERMLNRLSMDQRREHSRLRAPLLLFLTWLKVKYHKIETGIGATTSLWYKLHRTQDQEQWKACKPEKANRKMRTRSGVGRRKGKKQRPWFFRSNVAPGGPFGHLLLLRAFFLLEKPPTLLGTNPTQLLRIMGYKYWRDTSPHKNVALAGPVLLPTSLSLAKNH